MKALAVNDLLFYFVVFISNPHGEYSVHAQYGPMSLDDCYRLTNITKMSAGGHAFCAPAPKEEQPDGDS